MTDIQYYDLQNEIYPLFCMCLALNYSAQ